MKKFALIVFLLITLPGCATLEKMHERWLAENCNVTSAYSNGLTDGLKPDSTPNNYGNSCPANQYEVGVAYLRGFTKGLESRPKEIHVQQTVQSVAAPH